jgi:uncharacterized protein involved in exopolysaccharide biosynthesis
MAEIEIVKSHVLLENVAKITGFDKKSEEKDGTIMAYILLPLKAIKSSYDRIHSRRELTQLENSVIRLSKKVRIHEIGTSDIFEISYESKDAEEAKKIVNTLTDQYIDYRLDLYRTSQAYEFFQNQLSMLEQNLKESTQELKGFQERNDSIPSDEEKERILSRLSDAESNLRAAEIEEEELLQKIDFLRKEFERQSGIEGGPERVSDKVLDGLKEQLVSLQLKRSDLLQRYTLNHPQVITAEREIKSLQEMIKHEESKPMSDQISGEGGTKDYCSKECLAAETQLAMTKIRKKSLKDQIGYYRNRLSNFQNQSFTLKELQRKVKADEEAYNVFLLKLKESEIFMELDKMKVINATVLQYADIPLTPVRPKKLKNMLIAVLFGMMASAGSVFILEYYNHGLKNQGDVEQFLKVKVLASIPYKNGEKKV